jgi:hypothetical protein
MRNELEKLSEEQKRKREINLLTSRLKIYNNNLEIAEKLVADYKLAIAGIIMELSEKGVFFEDIGKEKFK